MNVIDDQEKQQITFIFVFKDWLLFNSYFNSYKEIFDAEDLKIDHPFTKYAMAKCWGQQVSGKFNNLFTNEQKAITEK